MEKKSFIFGLKWCCAFLMLLATYGLMFGAVANAATSTTLTTSDIADLTPDYVRPGAQKVPMLTLTLTDTLAEDFTRAKIRHDGTDKADITAVHLYAESAGSGGTFDPAADILLGSSSSPTATGQFTINLTPAFSLIANISQQFYVAVDVADTATNGNSVDMRIYASGLTIGGNSWPNEGINPDGFSTVDSIPPSIDSITGNVSGTTGEPTTITVTASDNTDIGSAKIFIDGDTAGLDMAESPDNTFTFDIPVPSNSTENIVYQVGVYDQAGNSAASGVYTITVTDNDSPVAQAGPDQTVNEDTIVNFDGSGSSDNIGIVSYQWNFGDGVGTASGASPTYTYPEPGTYTVTLTVTDAAGNSSSDSLVIIVLEAAQPPVEGEIEQIQSMLAALETDIQSLVIVPKGIKNNLLSKLTATGLKLSQAREESGSGQAKLLKAASNILRAFQNALRAQSGKGKIREDHCDSWSNQAEAIRSELGEIIGS